MTIDFLTGSVIHRAYRTAATTGRLPPHMGGAQPDGRTSAVTAEPDPQRLLDRLRHPRRARPSSPDRRRSPSKPGLAGLVLRQPCRRAPRSRRRPPGRQLLRRDGRAALAHRVDLGERACRSRSSRRAPPSPTGAGIASSPTAVDQLGEPRRVELRLRELLAAERARQLVDDPLRGDARARRPARVAVEEQRRRRAIAGRAGRPPRRPSPHAAIARTPRRAPDRARAPRRGTRAATCSSAASSPSAFSLRLRRLAAGAAPSSPRFSAYESRSVTIRFSTSAPGCASSSTTK